MSNGASRAKGTRGERDLVHLLPDAERVGKAWVKSIVDVTFNKGSDVAQVKNANIGGSAISENLKALAEAEPDKRHWVIFKPGNRKGWIICQTLDQFLVNRRETFSGR